MIREYVTQRSPWTQSLLPSRLDQFIADVNLGWARENGYRTPRTTIGFLAIFSSMRPVCTENFVYLVTND